MIPTADGDWRDDALCATVGGVFWFPEDALTYRKAIKICNECPVINECFNFAVSNHIHHGIWGGVGATERQRMRVDAARGDVA